MHRARGLAILAVVLAAACLVQGGGWNQNAHLALVRALSHGTPAVGDYRPDTGDLALHEGRLYSAKAPGLALATVGPYWALDRSGVLEAAADASGVPRDDVDLWLVAVLGGAAALGVTLVLVTRLGNAVAPGYGLAAAVTAGLGTLLLPFATLVFAHVLAASLGFAAFALLWLRPRGRGAALAAGLLAGLAVTVEYALGIVALGLAAYAFAGRNTSRAAAYSLGALAGVLPALAYNWWAFDSPLHFPYESALPIGGEGANERGLFGITWPSLDTATDLLLGSRGMLVIAPVLVCAVAALVPLHRRGRRVEASLIGGLTVAFLAYNAGYDVPFGGDSPGPRFLVALLPFLAVPLAVAYERWPWPTLALAVPSVVYAAGVTVTGPLRASGWRWVGSSSTATAGELARFVPLVLAAVLLAVVATARSRASAGTPPPP